VELEVGGAEMLSTIFSKNCLHRLRLQTCELELLLFQGQFD
jgi:hypothetical protein